MALLPLPFLFRCAHPCRYRADVPTRDDDRLLDLSTDYRVDNFPGLSEHKNFAEVYLAWNEHGLALQVEVKGKENPPQADLSRPRASDGVTFWLDTRDARTGHRATRYCHQFHFLPTGGGAERDEPAFSQSKLNRALEDSPNVPEHTVVYRVATRMKGYTVEAFLPAAALNGFDPEQHPRLGFFYSIRDEELGEQTLGLGAEFPFWEDPSLWSVLQLVK